MMPFAGGIDSLSNGTLIFSAGAALFYLFQQSRPPSWRRTLSKTAAIALLALLAYLEGGPLLLILGIALSAAGDAFLAQEREKPFLLGLGSFLAAHIAYVILFVQEGAGLAQLTAEPWRLALIGLGAIGAVILLKRLIVAVEAQIRAPVTAYAIAILAMLIAAATVPLPLVVLGAALFVASDAILASDKFLLSPASPHRIWTGPAVWVLYYLAQLLIALAFLI
jgi:uncharacterized membrane protein YhhN